MTQSFLSAHRGRLCQSDNAILCVIDFQPKVFNATVDFKKVRQKAIKTLNLADLFSVPTLLCEQYPKGLGHTDPEILEVFEKIKVPKEVFAKTTFSCFGEPAFVDYLQRAVKSQKKKRQNMPAEAPMDIILVGIESHICVLQTALDLLSCGEYRVVLLEDVMTGRSERHHEMALQRVLQAGGVVSQFESLAFEWTRSKDHKNFKAMSALIRD